MHATHQVIAQRDELQFTLGEDPCILRIAEDVIARRITFTSDRA